MLLWVTSQASKQILFINFTTFCTWQIYIKFKNIHIDEGKIRLNKVESTGQESHIRPTPKNTTGLQYSFN
jgi:hypothetical protein